MCSTQKRTDCARNDRQEDGLGIAFGSIGTGLPKDIVKQILAGEKIPLQKMEARKGKLDSKKSLLKDLAGRVEALKGDIYANKSARSFREFKVNVSGDGLAATVDKNLVEPGTYQVEIMALAQKSSAISNGVEDKNNTYIGVGYLQYDLPNGETKEIYIDEDHANLVGVAKLINGKKNGMQANVVNSGDGSDEPWKLLITLEKTGDDNKANFPNLYLVDGEVDIWLDGEREARDAKIKLDGFEIELPSNKATELIAGVTLDLKKAKVGDEITLDIQEDTKKMSTKLDGIVEKMNGVISFIKEQNNLDESSDTSSTLGGDITLQTLESRLRSTVFATIETSVGSTRIGELGLTFQRTGLVKLDTDKFQAALDKDYEKVSQVLNGSYTIEGGKVNGFMDNLEKFVKDATRMPGGILTSRKNGIETQMRQIDRRIESKNRQIEQKEKNLKAKFARLEETISKIKSQGSGLAGMGGMNPVQQLG